MSDRLTDERVAEIVAAQGHRWIPTWEQYALAREVRELRAAVSSSDEKYIGLLKVERDSALEALNCSRNKVQQLTRERDGLLAEQQRLIKDRDHWAAEVDRLRGVLSREIDTAELEKVQQLTRELAEANLTIDLQCKQIGHQARQCQEIEDELAAANIVREKLTEENKRLLLELRDCDTAKIELDEARDFNRRFRGLFAAAIFSDSDTGQEWIRVCRDYDATQTQHPQPTQTELVPWDAETFPADCEWLLDVSGNKCRITHVGKDGVSICGRNHVVFMSWLDIQTTNGLKWSRDGVNWQRCGTEVTR